MTHSIQTDRTRYVALLGAGRIAARHIRAIKATPGLALRHVVSRSLDKAAALVAAEAPEARASTVPLAAINDPATSVVLIAYPTADHARLVQAAFAAGKDVVCEKPLCATEAEAGTLLRLLAERPPSSQQSRHLAVCHIRRYWPAFAFLKSLVGPDGALGRATMASWTFWSNWSWEPSWRTEQEGGYLLDMHVHELDLLLWLLDALPQSAYAVGHNAAEGEATVLVSCQSPGALNGRTSARLEWCGHVVGHDYPANATHHAEIIGERGWVRLLNSGSTIVIEWSTGNGTERREWSFGETIATAWRDMWANFANYFETDQPLRVTATDAARALAAALAASRSLSSGQVEAVSIL